ncbi:MAG: cytochrome P460 family protein [Gammaproteobacteria bacterium]|nr:cytochrome P460 family protein [Gammaproteobacteria bacterium]
MKRGFTFLALAGLSLPAAAAGDSIPFPEGYRDWRHVKSMVIEQGHPLFDSFGGIHHLYANDAAVNGYRQGSFPDGAVIVFDLLEAVHADSAVTEGERKVIGVMLKDAQKFADTGGWGFEGFAGGDPANPVVGADAASACFACHASEADSDFVFSTLRD